jgi:hypothetical protein
MHRGLDHAVTRPAPSDVRAVHLLVGLRLLERGQFEGIGPALRRWARDIADCRIGDRLMNNPDERNDPHLWAHVQEGALAEAGRVFGDDDLIEVARTSARSVWEPVVRGGFDLPSVSPYDVACAVFCLDRLARVDHDASWRELAADARAWFDRVDDRGRAVYDRAAGRVADGVDEGRVSANSGAEANIVAADSLIDEALTSIPGATALLPSFAAG